jgi:hypothetical protein
MRPDFSSKRLSTAGEWSLIRDLYAETYPVRPLLNHVDELAAALREIGDKVPCINQFGFCASCSARAALERAGLPVTTADTGEKHAS